MKKSSKVFCLLFAVLMLFTLSITAFAGNKTNDGNIKIEVATNKSSYSATGVAQITATITNVSGEDINNVTAQAVFDDLAPAGKRTSETRKSVDVLKSGESFSFTYKATLNKNEHKLNFFEKIILWFVRFFNGGYTASNNSIDVVAENVTEIEFGKYTAENVIQVGYEINNNNNDDNNSDDSDDDITDIPTYEELIENVDIDEMYEYDDINRVIDEEYGIEYLDNIIIIMFEDDCTDKEKSEIINSVSGKVVGGDILYNELYVEVKSSSLRELEELCKELENYSGVDLARPEEFIYTVNFIPNDPFGNGESTDRVSWDTDISDLNVYYNNWWPLATELRGAWRYDEYFSNINIGIADTGFDTSHEDYSTKFKLISKENSSTNHGTHVAGIIGASHNNKGIAGVSDNSSLFAYDLAESNGEYKGTKALKALKELVEEYDCKVINFSIGANIYVKDNECYFDENFKKPISGGDVDDWGYEASKKIGKLLENGHDFVVVQAAGNGAKNTKLGIDAVNNGNFCSITQDNCYSNNKISKQEIMNRVIIVANANMPTTGNFELNTTSNGNQNHVDIAAPGTWIYSTVAGIEDTNNLITAGQKYGRLSGTSMASPIVAGVASLVWSVNKNFTGAQVKEMVCRTAEDGGLLVKDNPSSLTTGNFYLVNAKLAVEEAIKKTYWTCTVKGNVIDQNDESLSNVNIVATDKNTNKKIVAQNNKDGTFSLLLPCGTYSISLSKYDTEVIIDLDKTTYNQEIDLGEILMIIPESTVSGTVKDKDSQEPISNVTIDVYNTESEEYENGVETDENGYFKTTLPCDDNYVFTFCHSDYEEDYTIKVDAKTNPVELGDILLSKVGYEDSGKCGDNARWMLYKDGEIVVSGYGHMYNSSISCNKNYIKEITVCDGITSIGAFSFSHCNQLEKVTIPGSVVAIFAEAFYNCEKLTDVNISNGVVNIWREAFYNTAISQITIPSSVKLIAEYAFQHCDNLTSVTIQEGLEEIYKYAFANCTKLDNLTIPSSVKIIRQGAFSGCSSLKNIGIKSGIETIEGYTFYGTTIENITLPNTIKALYSETRSDSWPSGVYEDTSCFDGATKLKKVTFEYGITSIPKYSLKNCNILTNITIPDSVTNIGESAFYNCTNLTSITIPDSVTNIGEYTFYNCDSLTSIKIPNRVTNIAHRAFYNCSNLTSITIPNSVISIGDYAFSYCDNLTSITIPDSVTSIKTHTFEHCNNLTSITVDNSNLYYSNDENGVLFNKDKTRLIQYPIGNDRDSYIIPNSVISIDDSAFKNCTSLINITIPDSVTNIDGNVFYDCTSLTNIKIPDSVTSIGSFAFHNCVNLKKVILGNNITSIESGTFSDCNNLTSITIPNRVTSIEYYAFGDCTNLNTVYYTGSQEEWKTITIGDYNQSLTNATIHYNS